MCLTVRRISERPIINVSQRETHLGKENAVRKRDHFVGLWLDNAEYKRLLKQCELSGLTTSALIRHTLTGIEVQPRPPDTYPALLRELSAIGNNINQIAYWANARKGITDAEIASAAALVREAWRLIKETL